MQDHDYEDIGEAGATTGGVYVCRRCGHDPCVDDLMAACTPKPIAQPIDFVGGWDAVVVEPQQVTYLPGGFRIYLTEAQIDKLIEARTRPGDQQPIHEDTSK